MKSITDLEGVYASAVASGIRGEHCTRLDLGYLYVPHATACSVLGTRNHFKSPSVRLSQENAETDIPKLLLVNSGNANAVTGSRGEKDAIELSSIAAASFKLPPAQVLNASTGIIGVYLPMDKIRAAVPELTENTLSKNGDLFQKAIMTTDLVEKFSSTECRCSEQICISSAGVAKGSGMIAPNMGTMFAFIVLNAPMNKAELDMISKKVADTTFNMMSVDTDTSTSDMMVVFANGNGEPARSLSSEEMDAAYTALSSVSTSLCKQIARDGEGATKLIEVHVHEAATLEEARIVARAVSDSPLVKTAIHGADPNWGRVVMAIGKTPEVIINPERVSVSFGAFPVFKNGEPCSFQVDPVRQYLSEDTVTIHVTLGAGTFEATSYGCDLTKGYIDINTCYN
jgi:glutamate N-acetyltransferase / amino-acid N-acetyltransferase